MIAPIHRLLRVTSHHSPRIMTALAVGGTVMVAYTAFKAGYASAHIIQKAEDEGVDTSDKSERIRLAKEVAPNLIPVVASVVGTAAAMTTSHHISSKRVATVSGAYFAAQHKLDDFRNRLKSSEDYRSAVTRVVDKETRKKIDDEHVSVRAKKDIPTNTIFDTVLVYDSITGKLFHGDLNSIRGASNKVNHDMINNGYATLADFYSYSGLDTTPYSTEVGWNSDRLLEVDFEPMIVDDRPCVNMRYTPYPTSDYIKYY